MIRLAVEELCETADSLIAPVRLGVARPTAPFTLASSANDIINVSSAPISEKNCYYYAGLITNFKFSC